MLESFSLPTSPLALQFSALANTVIQINFVA